MAPSDEPANIKRPGWPNRNQIPMDCITGEINQKATLREPHQPGYRPRILFLHHQHTGLDTYVTYELEWKHFTIQISESSNFTQVILFSFHISSKLLKWTACNVDQIFGCYLLWRLKKGLRSECNLLASEYTPSFRFPMMLLGRKW